MNLTFKTIRWRNFLSTGNAWTELELDSHAMTLIVGANGSGKSSLLCALSFALFNKPYRNINKPQLVNSITKKGCLVEVEFDVGQESYKIVRGIRPNIFEIYRDGTLVNQDAAVKDYQTYLEKSVLRVNHKTFCQIVILGSAIYVPFMQLPTYQRRAVIEDLLDIQIFTVMNSILKDRAGRTERDEWVATSERDKLRQRLDISLEHARQRSESIEKQVDEKKASLLEERALLASVEAEREVVDQELAALDLELLDRDSVSQKRRRLLDLRGGLTHRRDVLLGEITFLRDSKSCPTCSQDIDPSHAHETATSKESILVEIGSALAELDEKVSEHDQRLAYYAEVSKRRSSLAIRTEVLGAGVAGSKKKIGELESEIERLLAGVAEATADLGDVEADLALAETKLADLSERRLVMDYVAALLKDTGIKARIVKQYVPIINKLVNKYLAALDFFVDFNLNEQFEETVTSRNRDDFSYASFSEGEKMRINIALLFTWRAVARLRSSISTNLLIMDEVFDGSLDAAGTEEFMKVLSRLTDGSNVLIISHRTDQLYDSFEKVVKFEKTRGFSSIAE